VGKKESEKKAVPRFTKGEKKPGVFSTAPNRKGRERVKAGRGRNRKFHTKERRPRKTSDACTRRAAVRRLSKGRGRAARSLLETRGKRPGTASSKTKKGIKTGRRGGKSGSIGPLGGERSGCSQSKGKTSFDQPKADIDRRWKGSMFRDGQCRGYRGRERPYSRTQFRHGGGPTPAAGRKNKRGSAPDKKRNRTGKRKVRERSWGG